MLETSLVQNRGVNNLTPRTFGYDFTVSSFEHPIDIQTPKLDSSIIWTQQNAENTKRQPSGGYDLDVWRISTYQTIWSWNHKLTTSPVFATLQLSTRTTYRTPISALSSFKNGLACCLVCPPRESSLDAAIWGSNTAVCFSLGLFGRLEKTNHDVMWLVWMKEDTGCCSLWNWLLFLCEKHCDFFHAENVSQSLRCSPVSKNGYEGWTSFLEVFYFRKSWFTISSLWFQIFF